VGERRRGRVRPGRPIDRLPAARAGVDAGAGRGGRRNVRDRIGARPGDDGPGLCPVTAPPVRLLIVADHPVVRQGLRTFLDTRPGFEVVGEAGDGETAVAEAARLRPDVILLDLVMPGVDGLEALGRIRAADPAARVLVLSSFASADQVLPALHRGGAGSRWTVA